MTLNSIDLTWTGEDERMRAAVDPPWPRSISHSRARQDPNFASSLRPLFAR